MSDMPHETDHSPNDLGAGSSGVRAVTWKTLVGGLGTVAILVVLLLIPPPQKTAPPDKCASVYDAKYVPISASSNDAWAEIALQCYVQAQQSFREASHEDPGKQAYAASMTELRGLLPADLIAAHGRKGRPYHGYIFLEMKSVGGVPVDWLHDFAMCAVPSAYGRTGYETLIVRTDGIVWLKDLGPKTSLLDDYPAKPFDSGWWFPGIFE